MRGSCRVGAGGLLSTRGRYVIRGEVPIGSGLKLIRALEVAVGYALLDASDHTVDRVELANLSTRGERICRHALWDHGSIHFVLRTRGARVAARLPFTRLSVAAAARRRAAGSLQYDGQTRAGERRV